MNPDGKPSPTPPPRHPHAAAPASAAGAPSEAATDDLVRIFNTALVTSRVENGRTYTQEMLDLVQQPAFKALLGAIRAHAQAQKIPERQAAEQLIAVFRKMDSLWMDYLIQEGVQKLKGPAN